MDIVGFLPVANSTTNIVDTAAYAIDNVASHLAGACDITLDLLAKPVVTHFVVMCDFV